jgi:DNA-binding transcriptional ArsR family regulator
MIKVKNTSSKSQHDKKAYPADQCEVFSVNKDRVRKGCAALLPIEQAQDIATIFNVLSHPTRVRLLRALASGEMCVCEISEVIGLSISATSHQLHQLRNLHICRSRSEGKLVFYSLQSSFVLSLLNDCAHFVTESSAHKGAKNV